MRSSASAAMRSPAARRLRDELRASSARVATSGPEPRSWARVVSETGPARALCPHGDESAATSLRVLSRNATSPARGSAIATSRTQPFIILRSVAAAVPSAHCATTRPAGGFTARTNGATTTARVGSLPAITASAVSRCARATAPPESGRAGQRTSVSPSCVHVVSTFRDQHGRSRS